MFQLPVCPYCHTVYRYKEVRKTKDEKMQKCYHCHKTFSISKFPGFLVLWLLVVISAVLLNIAVLLIMPAFNVIPLLVISFIAILLGLVFIPYFVKYKKIENKRKEN